MMKRKLISATLFLLAALPSGGCSLRSQEDFDAQPFEAEVSVDRNYQAAFADVLKGAQKCWGSGPMIAALPASYELQHQLYPDLGYGEVYSFAAGTVFMPQALVRIERDGAGAKVKVKTGPQAGSEKLFVLPSIAWAKGDVRCG